MLVYIPSCLPRQSVFLLLSSSQPRNYNIFFTHSCLVQFSSFYLLQFIPIVLSKTSFRIRVSSLHVLARPINLHRLPFSCQTRFRTGTTASPAFRFLDLFRTPNLHSLAVIILGIQFLHLYILLESQYKNQVLGSHQVCQRLNRYMQLHSLALRHPSFQ